MGKTSRKSIQLTLNGENCYWVTGFQIHSSNPSFFFAEKKGFQPVQNSRQSIFALGFAYLVSGIVTGFGQKSFARLSAMIMLHLTNPRFCWEQLRKSVGGEGGKHTKSRLVTVKWIPIPKIQRPLEMLREKRPLEMLREIVRRWKCENWESDLKIWPIWNF